MLEVTYTLTADDMVPLYTFSFNKSAEVRKRFTFTWVGFPLGLWLVAFGLRLADVYPAVPIGVAVGGAYFAVFTPFVRRWCIKRWARKQADDYVYKGFGRLNLTLTEEEFRVRGAVTDTTARWEKMTGIVVGAEYTFIFVTEQFAVNVSRVAMGNDARYAAVRDFAAARLPALSV